jgi:hypothetical protein
LTGRFSRPGLFQSCERRGSFRERFSGSFRIKLLLTNQPFALKEIEMNASKILAAAALSLLAAAGAHAETYDGVHVVNSSISRAEVAPQAVAAARAGNEYSDAASAGAQAFTSTANRATVQAEAVAKAHDPLQSLDRRAFYRDEVPQAYKKPSVSFTRQAGL